MLLFILAVGLAVTMGLMNFINLAHGAFAMAGGYITVLLMQRLGVPFLVCLPLAFAGRGAAGRGAGAHAVPAAVPQAAPGPGAVLHRPGLHGGGRGRLLRGLHPADHPAARVAASGRTEIGSGAWTLGMGHYRLFIIAVCAALTVVLQYVLSQHALRQPPARLGRRPARGRRPGHQRQRGVPLHLRLRLRPGRAWAARWAPRCWGWTRPSRSSS